MSEPVLSGVPGEEEATAAVVGVAALVLSGSVMLGRRRGTREEPVLTMASGKRKKRQNKQTNMEKQTQTQTQNTKEKEQA